MKKYERSHRQEKIEVEANSRDRGDRHQVARMRAGLVGDGHSFPPNRSDTVIENRGRDTVTCMGTSGKIPGREI